MPLEDCYRILGIDQEITWIELRQVYRRLIQRWHPDKVKYSQVNPMQAEQRFKEIQLAYSTLENYYHSHGTLPFPQQNSTEAISDSFMASSQAPFAKPKDDIYRHQKNKKTSRSAKLLVIALLSGAVYLVILQSHRTDDGFSPFTSTVEMPVHNTTNTDMTDNSHRSELGIKNKKAFTYGSTLGDVSAAQGVPDRVNNNTWYYGESTITFKDGVVISWTNNDNNPLNTTVLDQKNRGSSEKPLYSRKIHMGTTKNEVRLIQGDPMQDLGDVWVYGNSKIYFHQDQVISWIDSTLDPLKVE